MAHLAQLGAQADELVAAVLPSLEEAPKQRSVLREVSLRALRYHNFGRTNQFEVQERLHGLEERFRVVGRDALADALSKRLDAFEGREMKWSIEILHFLLELSDQPAQKSKISDLDILLRPEEELKPTFTWKDIAREDGWDDERALWENIDYSNSSDEEVYQDDGSEASTFSDETSLSSTDKYQRTAKDLLVASGDNSQLDRVQESQAWRYTTRKDAAGRAKKIPVAEYQVLREILFMLGGLETTLFDSKCDPKLDYQLRDVSWGTHKALISSFAECGRNLGPLRKFVATRQHIPLLQVFQDSVQKTLACLDGRLADMQGRFMGIDQDVVVSLINLLTELSPAFKPIYALAGIIRQLEKEPHAHAFRYLELLFDAAGTAQLDGSDAAYELLGSIFFDCFRIYLRPIRLWMEEGELAAGDRTFFVSESAGSVPLPQIWDGQFKLLRTSEGALHAPRFLQPTIQRIFTTGKSIVVLKHLGRFEVHKERWVMREPQMDFATVCAKDRGFAPFSEVFDEAFNIWIESKHHTASTTLRKLLFESYSLASSLEALHFIYLMTDGSLSDAFASAVFRHLDGLSASWKDRFTLTELAQGAFSSSVDSYRLSAQIDPKDMVHSAIASRASVRVSVPAIRLLYRLPWPLQVIIPDESVQGYHTIFGFLLQIRRAIYVLERHRFAGATVENVDGKQQAAYYLLRTKILWFCKNFMTYLTSLVLAPNIADMRERMLRAVDVDEMIGVHSGFVDRTSSECCLGMKLQPIRECILDILDLSIKLEDAQQSAMATLAEEEQEISRLSAISSPVKTPAKKKRDVYTSTREDEDGDPDVGLEGLLRQGGVGSGKPYTQILGEISADFERHLRFVTGGLRGVARARRDDAAAKWDLLAEMLEAGIREHR